MGYVLQRDYIEEISLRNASWYVAWFIPGYGNRKEQKEY